MKYVQLKDIYYDHTCLPDCTANNTHSDNLVQTIYVFHI